MGLSQPVRSHVAHQKPDGANKVGLPSGMVAPPVDIVGSTRSKLAELASAFSSVYSVELPLPAFSSLSSIKEFCSGLLDPVNEKYHPWYALVHSLPLYKRFSLSGSLFLFRKVIPTESPPDLGAYARQMAKPGEPLPPGYIDHVRRSVRMMFPVGWDSGYVGKAKGHTIPVSACLEKRRMKGGARGVLLYGLKGGESWHDRSSFCEHVLRGVGIVPRVNRVKVSAAPCDGKTRIVTKNSIDMQLLMPLHDQVYDHLSKKEWLLRGEAKPKVFRGFERVQGEVFVSGDFESATDYLSIDVAEAIFDCLAETSTIIPREILVAARSSLRCEIDGRGFKVRQARGQLMGNALSFPLLCLQNYLSFKWFVPRRVPVRINGDDIVFRCTPQEKESWLQGVRTCGLKVSLGKTLVDAGVFSLNSSWFRAADRRIRRIPVIRSSQWFKPVTDPSAIASRFNDFGRGFDAGTRREFQSRLLRKLHPAILATNCSLRRVLGLRVGPAVLKRSGLYRREVFYGSCPKEEPLPLAQHGYYSSDVPPGWHREFRSSPVDESEFYSDLVDAAWNPVLAVSQPDVWHKLNAEGLRWRWSKDMERDRKKTRRIGRLLRCRTPGLREWMQSRDVLPCLKKRERAYWVRCEEGKCVCATCAKERGEAPEVDSWYPSLLQWIPSDYQSFLLG